MMAAPKAVLLGLFLTATIGVSASAKDSQKNSADDDSGSSIAGFVSAGIGWVPDYQGSSHYKIRPYFEGRINKGNYYLRLVGPTLLFNVVDSSMFHAGPVIGLRRSRNHVKDPAVAAMKKIDYSMTGGGFVEYEHVAKDPRSAERVTLYVQNDLVGENSGWTVTARGVVRRPVNFVDRGLIASVEVDTVWADRTYMNTYFGVSGPDALASRLPDYRASPGFKSVGAALSLDQFLSRTWSVGLRFHYSRLTGAAADSPITRLTGSRNQYFFGLVVGYVI